jgi:ABC-2 type transport system permease protein
MTAIAARTHVGDHEGGHARGRRVLEQATELALRSVRNTARQPQSWIPGLVFPLMLTAVYTAQFAKAIHQPGFPPVDSYLDFVLPASILQAVAFGATNGGTDFALDIENGFFDRLVSSPVSRVSILVGRLAGSAVFAGAQALALMGVFFAFGVRIQGGVPAAIVVVATAVLLALAIGALGLVLALRTSSQEAVQSTFPVIFVLLFVSSAFWPTSLMKGGYQWAARHNPITLIIDPVRRLVIEGWSWGDAAQALGITVALATVTTALAFLAMRRRLRAT